MSVTDNGAYSVCSDLGSVNLQYRSELRFIYAEFRSSYQVYKMKLEPELPRLISSHWKLWWHWFCSYYSWSHRVARFWFRLSSFRFVALYKNYQLKLNSETRFRCREVKDEIILMIYIFWWGVGGFPYAPKFGTIKLWSWLFGPDSVAQIVSEKNEVEVYPLYGYISFIGHLLSKWTA